MELVLNRLNTILKMYDMDLAEETSLSNFVENISLQKFKKYAIHISTLKLDYRLMLEYLGRKNKEKIFEQQKNKQRQRIIQGALWLNALLIQIYLHTGDFNRKSKALHEQRQGLMHSLKQDYTPNKHEMHSPSLSTQIQYIHGVLNNPRNTIIRSIRALQATALVFNSHLNYMHFLKNFNQIANPVLAYAAWIFFIPRFLVNLAEICRHFLFTQCMNNQVKSFSNKTRTYLIKKNAIALMNDFIAITNSLANCFFLIGKLTPIGAYITAATFVFDVVVAIVHCIRTCERLKNLKKNYLTNQDNDAELNNALDKMMAYKKRKCIIQIMNTTGIFIAFAFTLPLFGLAPIIPLIAQCIFLLIILGNWIANKINEKTNPKKHNPIYNQHHFFTQKTNPKNEIPDIKKEEKNLIQLN